jgi:uncharacterized protein (DUF1810 family)
LSGSSKVRKANVTDQTAKDPFDLERFVEAQSGGLHERVIAELRSGRKRTHWMWFVFPQITGLGHSGNAKRYGIVGLDEARAYLAHPLLGARLSECAETLERLDTAHSATSIFPYPDDLKLRSCLTLFAQAAEPGSIFARLLDRYFAGRGDERTLELLELQGTVGR